MSDGMELATISAKLREQLVIVKSYVSMNHSANFGYITVILFLVGYIQIGQMSGCPTIQAILQDPNTV